MKRGGSVPQSKYSVPRYRSKVFWLIETRKPFFCFASRTWTKKGPIWTCWRLFVSVNTVFFLSPETFSFQLRAVIVAEAYPHPIFYYLNHLCRFSIKSIYLQRTIYSLCLLISAIRVSIIGR